MKKRNIVIGSIATLGLVASISALLIYSQHNLDENVNLSAPTSKTPSSTSTVTSGTSQSTSTSTPTSSTTSSSSSGMKNGSFTGASENSGFQTISVTVNIKNGVLSSISVNELATDGSGTSAAIVSQAQPMLINEAISTDSGYISAVSGATYFSNAFITSLQDALNKASA